MKTTLSIICALLTHLATAQVEKNALFIGNSYTYVNDLPGLVQEIASSKGNSFIHQSHTPGGSTLSQHATNISVQNLLNTAEWDYVILQDQSQNPSFPPVQVASQVYPYAESLCESIRQENNCSQPVFFMTWGRENGDAQNCIFYEPLCTYEGMQDRLIESYTEMAEDNNSGLAPVGIAWKNIRENYPAIDLYASDGSHPSIHGSYLAACVFYSVLFNETPENAYIPNNITTSEAAIIQVVAYNATVENEINFATIPEAIANYQQIGDSLYFYNESLNTTAIQWIGITQNLIATSDTLSVFIGGFTGEYEIQLSASDECTTTTHTIQIHDLKINEIEYENSIYPNPSTGLITYRGDKGLVQTISVYDTLGNCVFKKGNNNSNTWDFSHFTEGHYIIEFDFKNATKKQLNWLKKN